MSSDLGTSAVAVFARAGLPDESMIRVAELCKGRRLRIRDEELQAQQRREESAALQSGTRAIVQNESNARDDQCIAEQRHWDKLMRLYSEYRDRFQNEKEKHQRRTELETWRDIQVRKLEQEKYRQIHKVVFNHDRNGK